MHGRHRDLGRLGQQERRGRGRREDDPAVAARQRTRADPDDLASGGQLVEQRRRVAGHAARQDQGLQSGGGNRCARQLIDHVIDGLDPRCSGSAAGLSRGRVHVLPRGQEGGVSAWRRRLDFLAQLRQASAAQHAQYARLAPLGADGRLEVTLGEHPFGRQPVQDPSDDRDAQPVALREGTRAERAVRPGIAEHQIAQRVGHRLGKCLRHTRRQCDAESVAQAPRVLNRTPPLGGGDPELQNAALRDERGEPGGRLCRVRRSLRHFGRGQRAKRAQHVGDGFRVPACPAGREPLELALYLLDDKRVEQLAQLGLAEQLGEQGRVECQGLSAPLGQRRVALVHERADVSEQQRPAERRCRWRLDLHQPYPASRYVAHQCRQARHIEDVLQALPNGLEDDRERSVLASHRQQLRRALALLP